MTAATTASAVLRPADPTSGQGARRLVTALFDDDAGAERAFRVCVERGYEIGEINVVMSEDTRRRLLAEGSQVADDMATRKAEGGELGGPSGGRAAILVTILAAVSAALAVPTLGLAMAGPTAAALLGAGAAGLAAGLMGALGDWGLPDERVRQYEAGIRDGAILIGVEPHSEDDARTIEREWKALGGRSVHR